MEELLRMMETLFSTLSVILLGGLGTLIIVVLALTVGYLVWDRRRPRPSIAEEVERDLQQGKGNGIATKIRPVPLYLGMIGWLEVDKLEEYVILDKGQGDDWEEVGKNELLLRNPFAPPSKFRRVWKYPRPMEVEATGATRGMHQWDVKVQAAVRYSVADPTVAAVAHVGEGLRKALEGILVRIVNNYSEEELLTPKNWRASLGNEVLTDFGEIGSELGINMEEVMKIAIEVNQNLIDTIQGDELGYLTAAAGLRRAPLEARTVMIHQVPQIIQDDRKALIRLIVEKAPEIIIEALKAGRRVDRELLYDLIGKTAVGALKELPDPVELMKDAEVKNDSARS